MYYWQMNEINSYSSNSFVSFLSQVFEIFYSTWILINKLANKTNVIIIFIIFKTCIIEIEKSIKNSFFLFTIYHS